MGSTDEWGNRLSNLPGEERPSLTSVTPYDDDPEQLVSKVEALVQESRAQKLKEKKNKPESKKFNSLADKLISDNIEIKNSDRVKKNGGKQFDRTNFVKTDLRKTGKYKPALRGAAFTNKTMAKKSNLLKYRAR